MVDFAELRKRMQTQLNADKQVRLIDAEGATLDEAVREAATILELPVRRIDYEILEKGTHAFLFQAGKPYKIRAYAAAAKIDEVFAEEAADELSGDEILEERIIDADGEAFVQLAAGDALLKVTPPVGKGKYVTDADAVAALKRRRIEAFKLETVQAVVEEAAGQYSIVATFPHNFANDSFVRVEIAENEMKAWITITPPGIGGGDVPYNNYLSMLRSNGVIFGIREEELQKLSDRPVYGEKILAAEGKKAEDGADACIEYLFDVDPTHAKLKETDTGTINFKELNLIQNVREGDKLAEKIPPQKGIPGKTVTGKILPVTDGKDVPLPLGENVRLDKNDKTIVATTNGRVTLVGDKLTVEPVYEIDGSVGAKTGNIEFLGSVIISGNVEEGYSVKATGSIEVKGTVDKAVLDAQGDINVRQGIAGKPGIMVRSDSTVWAKFIENATVKAGQMVVVSDGILNSNVDAQVRIICSGKRARIIGGRLRATEEIISKDLGSPSGNTETICEVGIDPEAKEKFEKLNEKISSLQLEFDDLHRNIQTLQNIKKQRKDLPEEKEEYLQELLMKRGVNVSEMNAVTTEAAEIKEYFDSIKKNGRVSASAKAHAGTVVIIKEVKEVVRSDYRAVTFTLDTGLIRAGKFVDIDNDTKNFLAKRS